MGHRESGGAKVLKLELTLKWTTLSQFVFPFRRVYQLIELRIVYRRNPIKKVYPRNLERPKACNFILNSVRTLGRLETMLEIYFVSQTYQVLEELPKGGLAQRPRKASIP